MARPLTPRPPSPARGSCRECPVACDRLVYPEACVASECPRLYTHIVDGRKVIGCIDAIFGVEIDLERMRAASVRPGGFGALKAVRPPRSECRCAVERTFPHRQVGRCANPEFLNSAPAPAAVPARPSAG